MLNLTKTLKFAALAVVLGAAVPAMTTAASAAPVTHTEMRVAQNDRFDGGRDFRGDRHEGRFEHRGFEHGGWHRHHEFRGRHWR